MTTLTMEQRRADFEAMLKRVDLASTALPLCRAVLAETGGPLAALACDVAELCAAWADSAARARTRNPGDQAAARARIVAARCLQMLAERAPDGYLAPIMKTSGHRLYDGGGCDLGMDSTERISWLLSVFGDVASCYHQGYDPLGKIIVHCLRDLTVYAIGAALAAERGLWQEEA